MVEIPDDDDGGAAPETAAVVPPRLNPSLLGHEAVEAPLLAAHAAGRLPHAIILGGKRGIGKATLAYRLARFLLADAAGGAGEAGLFGPAAPASMALPAEHPVFKRIASGGHADLLTVERSVDPRSKRLRGEIVVDEAREVAAFLRLTPAEGGWRVVIVDGADEMNRNAANALLKILEEPPPRALLILVAHNPGRLLPTIRSRCRRIALRPLDDAVMETLLQRYRPDLEDEERGTLIAMAEGSIGNAMGLAASDGLALYRSLAKLLCGLPELDAPAVHAFAEQLSRKDAANRFRTASEFLTAWLARLIELGARGAGEIREFHPGEGAAMRRLLARRGLDRWVELWENLTTLFAQADGLNLEPKQVVLNAFFAFEAASR
jgi:DNA polymerase-3 subunit delta'